MKNIYEHFKKTLPWMQTATGSVAIAPKTATGLAMTSLTAHPKARLAVTLDSRGKQASRHGRI